MSNFAHSPTLTWQAQFLSALPAITSQACFSFRALPVERREEAVQEALAAACVAFHDLAVSGKSHAARPTAVARYSVLHVRNGRHVGGRQEAARDVMSSAARRRGVTVLSFDAGIDHRREDWKQMVIAEKRESIADAAAFRIDFAHWLGTRAERDRLVIESLMSGECPSSLAQRLGLTPGRVSQLRRQFERDWFNFQGQRPRSADPHLPPAYRRAPEFAEPSTEDGRSAPRDADTVAA